MAIIKNGKEIPNLVSDVFERLDRFTYTSFLEALDSLLMDTLKISPGDLETATRKDYHWVLMTLRQSQQKSKPPFNALPNARSFFVLKEAIHPYLTKPNGTRNMRLRIQANIVLASGSNRDPGSVCKLF